MELIQPPPAKGIGSANGREVEELELMPEGFDQQIVMKSQNLPLTLKDW